MPALASRFALAAVFGSVFLVSFDTSALVAAYPVLVHYFAAHSPADVSWTLNAYTLVYAAMLVPLGRWGDLHGRRRAFHLGVALFALGSLVGVVAPALPSLVAGRVAEAVGAALLTPAALALGLQGQPAPRRAAIMALVGVAGGMGAALGPALGSWLIELSSWRSVFLLKLQLCAVLLFAARAFAPEDHSGTAAASSSPDWPGAVMLVAGLAALVFGGLRLSTHPLAAAWTLALGAVLLLAFAARSRRHPSPVLDPALFVDTHFRFANLGAFVFGAAFGLMFLSSLLFLTRIWEFGQSRAGLVASVGPMLVIPFAILGGRWAARCGHRPVLIVGGALFALAQVWYRLRLGVAPDYFLVWLPGQLLGGAAIGLLSPALAGTSVSRLSDFALGTAQAAHSAIRQIGSVFGVAAGVAIVGPADAALPQFLQVHTLLGAAGLLTALLAWPLDSTVAS